MSTPKQCAETWEKVSAGDAERGPRWEWPNPRPIVTDLPEPPPFKPQVMLPPELADFVLDESDRMVAPPDYVAAALLVAMGATIGARCAIKPKRRDDWIVTPNLWGGVVGSPSTKKTPTINTVLRFFDRLEAKEADLLDERMSVFEIEQAAYEAHEAAVRAAMKKAAVGKGQMEQAMRAMGDLQPPEQPHARRFRSNDSTVPKMGELLSRNPAGMLVFRDELVGLLSSWDREGNEGDRAFYLESWNGTGSFAIDRIGRGSLFVKNLCLSVFGGIQPDLLQRYLSGIAHSMDNDGRIQRFQVLVYPHPVPWEWRDRLPAKGAREYVRDMFDRLASFDPVEDGAKPADDFVKLPHFEFTDEALEIFIEWSTDLHRVQIPNEQNPLMQQHLGKFEKLFSAIALTLWIGSGNVGAIAHATAVRAAAWCDYLAGHARRVYALVEAARVDGARTIAKRITEGKLPDGFTARDVYKKGWQGVKTPRDAEAALAVLEDHDWIIGHETDDQQGRPTTRYYANPKLEVAR